MHEAWREAFLAIGVATNGGQTINIVAGRENTHCLADKQKTIVVANDRCLFIACMEEDVMI